MRLKSLALGCGALFCVLAPLSEAQRQIQKIAGPYTGSSASYAARSALEGDWSIVTAFTPVRCSRL